ncbi:MAG: response regulator, partial [Deltaproteobacteria bacterium]
NGLGLVTWLRAQPSSRAVPIVVLTTQGGEEDRRRLLAAGATAYLTKPVEAEILVAKVSELLPRR